MGYSTPALDARERASFALREKIRTGLRIWAKKAWRGCIENMKTLEKPESQMKQHDIAVRAFHLWEKGGRHHHRDLEYWLQAEAELGAALPSPQAEESALKTESEHVSIECVEAVMAPAW
jgi:hypothetical protein